MSISFMSAGWEATVVSAFNGQATAKSLLLLMFIPLSLFSVGAAWYYFAKWRNDATENREMDIISQERIKAGLPPLTDDEKRLNK
ncbi:MAG: hypothetical protein EOO17_06060 [Chloroflexi bacterium]|nr:MAG: hypothetical protein EOO17_06060 [Chloroflexota bacterium]